MKTKKTVIIHLHVDTVGASHGGPLIMLENFLQPYFTSPGQLVIKTLKFNLTTNASIKAYNHQALAIATELDTVTSTDSNILFTLLCHSDEDRGDLTIGYSRRRGMEVASSIESVLELLFMPFERLVPGSLFFMFACGSVISNAASFDQFRKSIGR